VATREISRESRSPQDEKSPVRVEAVVNYTTKTQYLFRVNKGVSSYWNDDAVNRWVPLQERAIPFERMLYIGDGDTDIPSMKMVRHQGGYSIAVFDPEQWQRREAQEKAYKLIAEDRAHFVVPADYTDGSQLHVTVKGILGRIARGASGTASARHNVFDPVDMRYPVHRTGTNGQSQLSNQAHRTHVAKCQCGLWRRLGPRLRPGE
jgi:hypothetical protein